ncbi:hypothetical protein CLPUN_01600 [Clostridium puniceum]|uniref:Uncharacterized protein n=1 Tax=Clostridium puniceum TaxID=29367 RepID=A0A1S8TXI4_9CLOT|nr:hypothetical protein [Clostridium puniceum]OOM82458.1 hypothetical protein CLPUN_01600 [Clostridium puniceum]
MDREIYNDYLLIMPSGSCKGFNDLEGVKAYINLYYEKRFDDTLHEDGYNDATESGGDDPRLNVFTQLGVEEGKCEVYRTQDFVEILDNELIFEEDKEEIISKLSEAKIKLNIYDYGLDEILAHIQEVDVMEDFGEKVRS